jgi:GrpB-like predicted nucleotidyltransferase (UPF0157 family)
LGRKPASRGAVEEATILDEIRVEPHDPSWPASFAAERQFILGCFTEPPTAIEHIGSTAVPGLAAKPVIDISVLVDRLSRGQLAIPALEAGGYSYWRDNPDTTKLFLVKGLPPAPRRTNHLHIYEDPAEFERHVAFRDRLRADPRAREAYEALKRRLALQFRDDREAYTAGKSAFIDNLIRAPRA